MTDSANKTCRDCGQSKDASEFYSSDHHRDKLRPNCKNCFCRNMIARRKILYATNSACVLKYKKRNRKANLKQSFGITTKQYDLMEEKCFGVCEICSQLETWPGRSNLAVDHCHKTGIIRGLLCASCNKALGGFKDDPVLLLNAVLYLLKSRKESCNMSNDTTPKKAGPLASLLRAAENVVAGTVAGVDSVLVAGATAVGKLLTGGERAEAEEALEDVVDGFKADDATTSTVAPAAPAVTAAPEAPADSAPATATS